MSIGLHLALREIWHWRMSALCQAFLVASITAPLMILSALQFGVMRDLRSYFEATPDNLRLFPVSSATLSPDWFAKWRQDPRVGFLAPHPYENAVELRFESPSRRDGVDTVILGSGAGDLMLPAGVAAPREGEVVITASLAEALSARVGDQVALVGYRAEPETYSRLLLKVVGVTPRSRWSSEGALVPQDVVTQAWLWRQGYASSMFGRDGDVAPDSVSFPRFRLYARSLSDLQPLAASLKEAGVEVTGNFADAELADAIESGARTAIAVLAICAILGAVLALTASFLADAVRLRPSVALLRLDGVTRSEIRILLFWKALLVSAAGVAVGALLWLVGLAAANAGIAEAGLPFATSGRLPWPSVVLLILSALAVGIFAGLFASWTALRVAGGGRKNNA